MRRARSLVVALASIALSFAVLLCAGAFFLFETGRGQAFLEAETEKVVGRLLGPDYLATIGRQSISLAENGRLAIRWDDVAVKRAGMEQSAAKAKTIAVGLDGFALLRGDVRLRSLDVSGADVDVMPSPEASEVAAAAEALAPGNSAPITPPVNPEAAKALLPALTARLLGQAEKQIAVLRRLGIAEVNVADVRLTLPIAPGGGPFVAHVDRLRMGLDDPRAMLLAGTLRVDDSTVPVATRVAFDPEAGRLADVHSRIGPFDLGRLLPPASRDDRVDMRPFGSASGILLALDVATPDPAGPRTASFRVELDAGHLQQGRGHTDIRKAAATLRYVEGEDRIAVGPIRVETSQFEADMQGTITPVYDRPADGGFNGFAFDLASTTLKSSVGSENEIDSLAGIELSGRTDVSRREGRFDRIELRSGDGALAGTASVGYGGPDARMRIGLEASNLSASAVKAFWPFDVAVAPRAWVLQNVGDTGRAVSGRIALDVTRQRMDDNAKLGTSYTAEEMQLDFALQGLRLKSFGELPALVGADGTIETRGGDTLVTIAKAGIEDMPDMSLEGGLVTFGRVYESGDPLIEMRMTGNFDGPASDMARVTEHAPLSTMVQLPVKPEALTGGIHTVADLTLLMGDKLPNGPRLKTWKLGLDLENVGSHEPVMGRKLADISGTAAVAAGAIEGNLRGRIDGAMTQAKFRRALGEPIEGPRLSAELRIDAAEAVKLAPALQDVVSGGAIQAKVVQPEDGGIDAAIDLSGPALNLPWVGWRKGKGVDARLALDVRSENGRFVIDGIDLKGDGFAARGSAEADAQGLRTAALTDVALNPGDAVGVKLNRVDNGYSVSIRGARFDARPLLADIRADIGGKTAKPKRGGRQFDVTAAVSEVVGFGKETISDFALDYAGSGSRIAALSLSGSSRGGAPFSVELSPRGEARSIAINAANAGALLDFTGAYGHMDGGKMRLDLVGSADDGYSGKIEMKDFTLVDEPRLSRLVAAPPAPNSQSLSQAVGRNLQTARAPFDHASAGIAFGKAGLGLRDGIIRGPIFGSSFMGTLYDSRNQIDITGSFMPAYGLNRVFGAIPVVGQILGNGREGGLIGITYRISGDFSSPKLEVNPISAIAPGIFRNIFAYQ